jgi:histone deacetylase complex subunit SAP30
MAQLDFGKMDLVLLKRYKRHYRVRTKHNPTKAELAQSIARHFAALPVLETDAIPYFLYAVKNQGGPRRRTGSVRTH